MNGFYKDKGTVGSLEITVFCGDYNAFDFAAGFEKLGIFGNKCSMLSLSAF